MSVTLFNKTCAVLLAAALSLGTLAPMAEAGPRDERRWEQRHHGPPGHAKRHHTGKGKAHARHDHRPRHVQRDRGRPEVRYVPVPVPAPNHGWQQRHPRDAFYRMSREDRYRVQRQLAQQGYYRGPIDGAWGPGTWNGMNAWNNNNGGMGMGSMEATLMLLQALLR
ncbi:peptidoglycan-binding domain-containing protein [Falsigemmobacter faecalis]|uniref:Peptidoglycan-binding protein n=1 Tax=Falsigemmobacter faecalis TaxID=2488730 RepID=A0A3P3DJ83_9RHOB|nr:peptidoglycan-binding domain-containing protein [Falsigemmobacter faecalis]RRH74263.1 peptidoglycan-binding protein [Falsigemmobacter faecalis]